MAKNSSPIQKVRSCSNWVMFGINVTIAACLIISTGFHHAKLVAKEDAWDGPTVVTIVLTAATLVMAGVTLMVGIVAIWGYSTLRDRSEEIAGEAARAAIEARQKEDYINGASFKSEKEADISSGYDREKP